MSGIWRRIDAETPDKLPPSPPLRKEKWIKRFVDQIVVARRVWDVYSQLCGCVHVCTNVYCTNLFFYFFINYIICTHEVHMSCICTHTYYVTQEFIYSVSWDPIALLHMYYVYILYAYMHTCMCDFMSCTVVCMPYIVLFIMFFSSCYMYETKDQCLHNYCLALTNTWNQKS